MAWNNPCEDDGSLKFAQKSPGGGGGKYNPHPRHNTGTCLQQINAHENAVVGSDDVLGPSHRRPDPPSRSNPHRHRRHPRPPRRTPPCPPRRSRRRPVCRPPPPLARRSGAEDLPAERGISGVEKSVACSADTRSCFFNRPKYLTIFVQPFCSYYHSCEEFRANDGPIIFAPDSGGGGFVERHFGVLSRAQTIHNTATILPRTKSVR